MNFHPRGALAPFSGCRRLLLACSLLAGGSRLSAGTFTVFNTADTGGGSLRQAILDANANSGLDTIAFQIPGIGPFTISPLSTLPPITDPVIIDGTTQPGYVGTPRIELNGTSVGANGDGLLLLVGDNTVRGLAINRCKRDGIRIQGSGNNVIQGNFIGTDLTGTLARGNVESGVFVFRSPDNLIGGTNAAARNIISGGNPAGIFLVDPASTGNTVQGNFIGTTVTGLAGLGNLQNGIVISAAPQNLIGGVSPGAGNIISGNGQSGIYLLNAGAAGNIVQGNFIGTDATGAAPLSNAMDGVTVYGAVGNTIGGTDPGARNIISGNTSRGVLIVTTGATSNVVQGNFIGTDVTGKLALGNHTNGVAISGVSGNFIGGTNVNARNVISGNQQSGVLIIQSGATSNSVQGNFIGVDVTGAKALANTASGVNLDGVAGNLVGGGTPGAGNVLSGNAQNGVFIGVAGAGTNRVQGNFIGTDSTGTKAVGNSQAGIRVEVPGNTIGGTDPALRNLISGNAQSGIFVFGAGASNNWIAGNFIGTDLTGAARLGNAFSGISLSNAPANLIGGITAGARNLISANTNSAIVLQGAGVSQNLIQGNYLGTDVTGGNALGNVGGGIYFYGSPGNTIGGSIPGAGNLISGNFHEGISVGDPGANGNVIQGNFIGTKADGVSNLGNELHNIDFLNTASGNWVGGSTPDADNRLAFTRTPGYDGVRIRDGCLGNFVSRNSFFSNGASSANGLGIDVSTDGVTVNNLATATEAISGDSATTVRGAVNGYAANKPFLLQFYANVAMNVSGYGEGLTFIGSTNITTDAAGHADFTLISPTTVPPGRFIAATTTDNATNTFEFSTGILVVPPPSLRASASRVLTTNAVTHAVTTNVVSFISWPANPPGFVLLTTTNLLPPILWSPATNLMISSAGTNTVTLGPTGGNAFYRLLFQ
ncbi:MAG: repeat-containing protein [Pedosphaera sp.]|nr:repeat-containing protein [Pedosphaera sp.]